jgi:hypothetical protein
MRDREIEGMPTLTRIIPGKRRKFKGGSVARYRCPYCESRRLRLSNMWPSRLRESIYSCSRWQLWSRQSSLSVSGQRMEGRSGAHIRRIRSNERNENAVFAVICRRSRTVRPRWVGTTNRPLQRTPRATRVNALSMPIVCKDGKGSLPGS